MLIVLCVIWIHSAIVLNYWIQKSGNLCSQSHFHHSLSARVQVSVHHIGQQVTKSTFCLSNSFRFNMSSHLEVTVSRLLLTIIPHPRFSTLQGIETVIYMVNNLMLHVQCKVNSLGDINYSQCIILVITYLSAVYNFFWLHRAKVEKTLQTNEFGSYNITKKYTMWKLMYTRCNIHTSYKLLLCDIFSFHKRMFSEQWDIILS